jgi:hypothetical protein
VKTVKAEKVGVESKTRDENFCLLFKGFLNIEQAGEYEITLASDDGSFLFMDGVEVVSNGGMHGVVDVTEKLTLKAGKYPIKVTFYQGGGGYDLKMYWKPTGAAERQEVPATAFFVLKADLPAESSTGK